MSTVLVMPVIVTRSEWGARSPKRVNSGTMTEIPTCHWNGPTLTIGGKTTWDHSKCAAMVRGIQSYHMDAKGWNDIAYNFVECPHGYTFEGRGLNVWNGANGTNHGNRNSHAVMCLAGEGNPFPEAEKQGFKKCINYISRYAKAPNRCRGHRDHKSTQCPGDARYKWVHAGMPVESEEVPTKSKKEKDMDAAIRLMKRYYDKVRGTGAGKAFYDPEVKDKAGWEYWLETLLETYDAGKPLKGVTDWCGYLLLTKG